MTPVRISLLDALSRLADDARQDRADPPIIETDLISAMRLAHLIEYSLGGSIRRSVAPDCVIQYDGVKIVARRPDRCKLEVDGWREHFGPLAEVWS